MPENKEQDRPGSDHFCTDWIEKMRSMCWGRDDKDKADEKAGFGGCDCTAMMAGFMNSESGSGC